jgi:carbonic anhydrase/acetyltransferase-like protein (isoleucine patch superfamily)
VSPVVKRRLGRGWQIEIAVPFEPPAIVGRVVAIAHAAMLHADARAAGRVEVVLTAQEAQVQRANVRRLNSVAAAPLATSEREVMAWTGTNTSRASS